jgi:hypothetical protein
MHHGTTSLKLPRDVDIRSGAFLLFAFVVVVVFSTFATASVWCRLSGNISSCLGSNPETLATLRSWIENILAILLALMAGTRPPAPPPPSPPEG